MFRIVDRWKYLTGIRWSCKTTSLYNSNLPFMLCPVNVLEKGDIILSVSSTSHRSQNTSLCLFTNCNTDYRSQAASREHKMWQHWECLLLWEIRYPSLWELGLARESIVSLILRQGLVSCKSLEIVLASNHCESKLTTVRSASLWQSDPQGATGLRAKVWEVCCEVFCECFAAKSEMLSQPECVQITGCLKKLKFLHRTASQTCSLRLHRDGVETMTLRCHCKCL